MLLKQPKFWQSVNAVALLLWPLSLLYALISKILFKLQKSKKFNAFIICIGNANIGGAGKTPLAIAIGKFLKKEFSKLRIVYACRNYAGTVEGPVVLHSNHFQDGIIDEALLLVQTLPVVVAKSRFEAIKHACTCADIVISDDGLQNNSFHKDLSILAIPSDKSFGNGFILPAGPLRETLASVLKRANVAFLMNENGSSHAKSREILNKNFNKKAIFSTHYERKIIRPAAHGSKKKVIAFCSIARPEQFFDSIPNSLSLIDKIAFPDHHVYSKTEKQMLFDRAQKSDAALITTEKDFVKFHREEQKQLMIVKIATELSISSKEDLKNSINRKFL